MQETRSQHIETSTELIQTEAIQQVTGVIMPKQKPASKLETLRQQQKDLAAKLREAEAQVAKEAKAAEAKKHQIVGALILNEITEKPDSPLAPLVRDLLKKDLTKANERALFDLPPLPKSTKPKASKAA